MKKLSKLFVAVAGLALVSGALVACGGNGGNNNGNSSAATSTAIPAELKDAYDFVNALYKNEGENTPTNYARPTRVTVGDLVFPITWTAESNPANAVTIVPVEGNDLQVMVTFDEMTTVEIAYTLKAEISTPEGGLKVTLTWDKKVPAFKELSWDEYVKAIEDGKASSKDNAVTVVVKGVVTAMSSKTNGNSTNTVYLQDLDGKGAFYCYGMAADPAAQGIEIGMTVRASGGAYKYSGTYEIAVDCILEILDQTKNPVAAKDITADFVAASDTTAASITDCQGLFVTLKGATILVQDDGVSNGYYKFSLGGKTSYVRISSSVCPLSKADQATFKDNHKNHTGYLADVTGVISLYDGAFYITPVTVDAYSNFVAPEMTDAEKVAAAKETTTIPASFNKAQNGYQLPVKGAGVAEAVTIAWAMKEASDFASITDNKLTTVVPEDENKTVVLVATFTCGDATDTKEYTLTLELNPTFITAVAFNKLEKDAVAYVQGYVTKYNDQYKSCYLVDGSGEEVYLYGWKDKTNINIKNGDWLQVKGTVDIYNGTYELKNAEMYQQFAGYSLTEVSTVADKTVVLVTGKVKSILVPAEGKQDFGNIYIEDEDGNELYIYGTYNTDGQKYGDWAAEDKLAVGDVVYIYGEKSTYNNTTQVKNGTLLLAYTPAAPIVVENDGTAEHPYTPEEALEIAKDFSESKYDKDNKVNIYGDLRMVYVKGYVVEEGADKGTYQQNFKLASSLDGTTKLIIYTCNETDAIKDVRLNDYVVVKGYIMNYQGTIEVSNGQAATDEKSVYPEFVTITRGTGSISISEDSSEKAEVTLSATSGVNASTFTFTVTVDEGFEVDVVTVNGTTVTDTDGTYTGTISGTTVVKVTTKEAGSIKSVYTLTVDGLPTAYPKAEAESTLDGLVFIQGGQIANFGNGIQIKKDAEAWLKNKAAFELPVLSVVFNFNAKNAATTITNQTANKGVLYIMFANNADFTNAETVQVTIAEAEKAESVTVTTTLTDAKYIKICSNQCGAVYCDSIVINLNTAK